MDERDTILAAEQRNQVEMDDALDRAVLMVLRDHGPELDRDGGFDEYDLVRRHDFGLARAFVRVALYRLNRRGLVGVSETWSITDDGRAELEREEKPDGP